ncbi:MAG TPA: DUF3857 domain-containing protein [Candidatus Binatia bacterium]|nr:DUF3857 domain-containing protein [Candidatus Binatia bacterium]
MKRHEAGRRIAGALLCGAPIILAATLIVPGSAAEKDDAAAWPEITEQERALKSIPQDPDADGVILRRTRDGKIIIEKGYYVNVLDYHWRMKVLNERGKRHAEVHIPSHKYSRVEGIEARSIKPDGTIVPVAADQIFEKLVEKGRGYKITEQVFTFPAVEPGTILEYRFRRHRAGLFGLVYIEPWYFAGPEFTLLSRMTQGLPKDASYRLLCNRCPNPEPDTAPWKEGKVEGKRITLEMKNVPAYTEELMMPPASDVSPRMEMVLTSWNFVEWEALGRRKDLFTDWDSVARYIRFYYQKSYRLDEVAVKQVVASWTNGVSDPNDRIKAVFRHIQEDFRYIPYDELYGNVSPIATMLKGKSADNEDKAILLLAALRSMKVQANLALVVGKQKGMLISAYPSLSQFSHVIVAVPQPDGSALWLDPTVTYAPFGFMPWQDSGAGALYITETGSALINLPRKDEVSATRYDVTVKPRVDGKADLEVVAEYEGEDAIEMRQELVPAAESARASYLEEWLRGARPGAALRSHLIENLDTIDKPLRIKMQIEASDLVMRADELMLVRACVLDCREVNPISKRERLYPFYADVDWNDRQTVTVVPPAGMKGAALPAPATAKSAIGTLTFACSSQADGAVRCERRYTVPRNHWPPDQGAGIRAMFDKIVEIDRTTVALQPVEGGSPGH